jgi:hypothetical protein
LWAPRWFTDSEPWRPPLKAYPDRIQKKQKKIKEGKTMKMYRKMVSKYGKE